jgi:hypothetical protein
MMVHHINRRLIEAATVTIVDKEGLIGRGILVPGQLILTAAHCLTYDMNGHDLIGLSLGDHCLVHIDTAQGQRLHVTPLAIDHVADIAVLGALDNQTFYDQADAFEAWCERTIPAPLCCATPPLRQPIPAFVYDHTRQWLEGTVELAAPWPIPTLALSMPDIQGGTSGSAIVTEDGSVIGIVSQTSTSGGYGPTPWPWQALPVWVVVQMRQAEEGGR